MIAELIERRDLPTDKTTQHAYGAFYDLALAPYRGRPIRLLEIGVLLGGSLRLWDAYFCGAAEIVGVDIGMRWGAVKDLPDSIALHQTDAYTEWAAEMLGSFDVIVDDGPHTLESQLAAVRLYAPRLRPGGLLVVEDVQHREWVERLAAVVPTGFAHEVIDLSAVTDVTDDRLFIVRRP